MSDRNTTKSTSSGYGIFVLLTFIICWIYFDFDGAVFGVAINCMITFLGSIGLIIPVYGIYWYWHYTPEFIEMACQGLLGVDGFGWFTFIYVITGIIVTIFNLIVMVFLPYVIYKWIAD